MGETGHIVFKGTPHIVVELPVAGRHVHGYNGFLYARRHIPQFILHKIEIGHRMTVIIFKRVGIQTDKTRVAHRKSKIILSENFQIYIEPRPQTIMIPQQANIRHPQLIQEIPCP